MLLLLVVVVVAMMVVLCKHKHPPLLLLLLRLLLLSMKLQRLPLLQGRASWHNATLSKQQWQRGGWRSEGRRDRTQHGRGKPMSSVGDKL